MPGRDVGARDGQRVVRRLGAAEPPVRARHVAGLEQVAVDEAGFGRPALGAGARVEQPVLQLDLNRHDPCRIDTQLAHSSSIGRQSPCSQRLYSSGR